MHSAAENIEHDAAAGGGVHSHSTSNGKLKKAEYFTQSQAAKTLWYKAKERGRDWVKMQATRGVALESGGLEIGYMEEVLRGSFGGIASGTSPLICVRAAQKTVLSLSSEASGLVLAGAERYCCVAPSRVYETLTVAWHEQAIPTTMPKHDWLLWYRLGATCMLMSLPAGSLLNSTFRCSHAPRDFLLLVRRPSTSGGRTCSRCRTCRCRGW